MYSMLGRGSSCFNYCLNSAWHGGDQFVSLIRFSMGFRSGEFAGQSSTPTPWSFNQLLGAFGSVGRCQILLENEISIFKKLVSRRKHEVLQNLLVNGCSDVGFQKKTPLTTTVAKFLDTSVCGGSWCLDPSLSPFFVKFTQILESILLDNPHKAAVLSVGCAYFPSRLFPSTQLSVYKLGYSTLWTASFFGNECMWLTLLVKGVNDCLLDNCQISSLPHDCVA